MRLSPSAHSDRHRLKAPKLLPGEFLGQQCPRPNHATRVGLANDEAEDDRLEKRSLADSPFNRWGSHRRPTVGLVKLMVTGAQIREARSRVAWSAQQLANRAHVPEPTVKRAERSSAEAAITLDQERKIRAALQVAGIEFSTDGPTVLPNEKPRSGG